MRRIGNFKVTRQIVLEGNAGILGQLFQHVFPIAIEWDWNGVGTYTAISEWFEEIDEGVEPPDYEFIFHSQKDGPPKIETKRRPFITS